MKLTESEKQIVLELQDWSKRMKSKFGSYVLEINNKKFDWGEALCRQRFGHNFKSFMREHNITKPSEEDLKAAHQWEAGETPSWVKGYANNE